MSVGMPVAGSTYVSVWPPRRCLRSITSTLLPASRNCTALKVPEEPPPITQTSRSIVVVRAEALRGRSCVAARPAAEYDRNLRILLRRRCIGRDSVRWHNRPPAGEARRLAILHDHVTLSD